MARLAIFSFFLTFGLFSCYDSKELNNQTPQIYPAFFTQEQILDDFHIFRKSLEEGHGGIYHFQNPEKMEKIFLEAKSRLSDVKTESEFYLILAWVASSIKDGHTSVIHSRAYQNYFYGQKKLFPFAVTIIDGRVYVRQDLGIEESSLIGLELVSINDIRMAEILSTILPLIPSDGANLTGKYIELESVTRFSFLYQALYGPTNKFNLQFILKGEEKEITLGAIDLATYRRIRKKRYADNSSDLELLISEDRRSTAILTIREFWGDEFPEFMAHSFLEIKNKAIKNLIIDLRGNGGGEESYGKLLISYVYNKPFVLYESAEIRKRNFDFMKYTNNPWLGFKEEEAIPASNGNYQVTPEKYPFLEKLYPNENQFTGKLIILIDGGSFSTTSDVSAVLHANRKTEFIGTETGGNYYGNTSGEIALLTLPNTKLRIRIPLVRFNVNVSGYEPTDRGIIPQHKVEKSPESLKDNSDPVMDYALNRLNAK